MFTNSNYTDAGGVSAGYTMNPSQPDPSSQNPVGRRSKLLNVVPMQILDLVQQSEEDGPLSVQGQEVGFVKIVGQVLE